MADVKMTKTTPQEVVVSVVFGLLAPLIAIVLILMLINSIQSKQIDTDTPAAREMEILKNISPVTKLAARDPNAPIVLMTGEEVFKNVCTECHTAGALGAPVFGNKGDWGKRIAKGYPTLIKHALGGFNNMPSRGGDPDLEDVEVERAIAYMANAAGAHFKAPEPPPPAKPAASAKPGSDAAAAAGTAPATAAGAAPATATTAPADAKAK